MPIRLPNPVLTVDAAKLHDVDTANAQSLHGMWMGELTSLLELDRYWYPTSVSLTLNSFLQMRRLHGGRPSVGKLKLASVD